MDLHTVISLILFSMAFSFTPGPNNFLLANTGANHSFKACMPLIAGILIGAPMILFVVAAGGKVIFEYEWVRLVLKGICVLFLFTIAIKIGFSPLKDIQAAKPISFFQIILLQWVNPKVWSQNLMTVGLFITSTDHYLQQIFLTWLIFVAMAFFSASTWALFGKLIRRFLKQQRHWVWFNRIMAIILIVATLPEIIVQHL